MHDGRDVIWYTLAGLCFLAVTAVVAGLTRLWVLTALPVGFLFGFFLQKGDLCGASAFSEVILMKDTRKVFGLWVCIVVSMLGFALGDLLGWVSLNPKPMLWLNYIIGGIVFGVGTVLAGGCVSGCLFKGATGNLNSLAALVAMPAGIALVAYGPLHELTSWTRTQTIPGPDGQALSLQTITGLPFWSLALLFAVATGAVVYWRRRGNEVANGLTLRRRDSSADARLGQLMRRVLTRSWKPWQAGAAIGVLALFAYMSSASSGRNYPLGVTHGVLQAYEVVTESELTYVYQKPSEQPLTPNTSATAPRSGKRVVGWLVLVVLGLAGGAFTSGKMSGQAHLLPKPPEQVVVAAGGGFLVGAGAAVATGCVVGNIMSGWALLSVGMVLFGFCTILANWVTTYFYLMGGRAR